LNPLTQEGQQSISRKKHYHTFLQFNSMILREI